MREPVPVQRHHGVAAGLALEEGRTAVGMLVPCSEFGARGTRVLAVLAQAFRSKLVERRVQGDVVQPAVDDDVADSLVLLVIALDASDRLSLGEDRELCGIVLFFSARYPWRARP